MAHSILTPLVITREALRILHGKLSFIGTCNREYDSAFANDGAKIGTTLNIRRPSKYTVRTNATFAGQDHVETSVPLVVSSQYGVDVSFTTVDMTMNLDKFSERVLKPAMTQLAAKLEADAMAVAYKQVYNYQGTTSTQMTYRQFQQAGQTLTENLAGYSDRTTLLDPVSRMEFNDAVKGLFQSSENISDAYREGVVGRTGGFEVMENTFIPKHTRGSIAGSVLTTGAAIGVSTTANAWASQTSLTIDTATSATTLKAGDIITVSGVYDVHPESKVNTGTLKRFVVQSDVTLTTLANTYTPVVVPAMIYGVGNAFQNCALSGPSDTDNNTITVFGVASTTYGQCLAYHKDAFVFATADLVDVAKFGAWGSRASQDGISMRLARQYAVTTDTVLTRFDVLWGFQTVYPELAVRHFHA